MGRSWLAPLVIAGCLLASGHARADGDAPDALVARGLELRRQGRDAEALDVFRRAYASRVAPRTLAQIAFAEQALGRWLAAEEDLSKALSASSDPWISQQSRVLEDALAKIRQHVGLLEVTADVPATLWVNGARVGVLPAAPIHVEAGSVIVEVRAEGYESSRRITSVEPSGRARESVHLVPLAPKDQEPPKAAQVPVVVPPSAPTTAAAFEPPASSPPRHPEAALRDAGIVALGAGVLGLASSAYFGVRTLQTKSDRDEHCPAASGCDAQGVADDRDARMLALRSTAWFVGGLGAAATGVVLLVLSRPRGGAHGLAEWTVTPEVGPNRAHLSVAMPW